MDCSRHSQFVDSFPIQFYQQVGQGRSHAPGGNEEAWPEKYQPAHHCSHRYHLYSHWTRTFRRRAPRYNVERNFRFSLSSHYLSMYILNSAAISNRRELSAGWQKSLVVFATTTPQTANFLVCCMRSDNRSAYIKRGKPRQSTSGELWRKWRSLATSVN